LPDGLTVNPATGLISGTLGCASAGTHTVTATVSDGVLAASQTFTWTVTSTNCAPTLVSPGNMTNGDGSDYRQVVLADGPLQYLQLGALPMAPDLSGHGRVGVYHGAIGFGDPGATGDGTTSAAFDGSNGTYVDADLVGYPFGTGSLSMEAWIRTTAADGVLRFLADNSGGWSNARGVNIALIDGELYWRVANGMTQFILGSAAPHILNDGAWHHVVCVLERLYDGAQDRMLIYIDGALNRAATLPAAGWFITSPSSLELGRLRGADGYGFIGSMSEWAVYQTALGATEIAEHHARRTAVGESVALPVAGSDPDGDTLTYSATGLPAGFTIDPATGVISGTLDLASVGPHLVTVSVSDGTLTASEAFNWTITNSNQTPVLANPGTQSSGEGLGYAQGVLAAVPVQHLRLGEPSGGVAADWSGFGRTGTYHGSIAYGQPGAIGDGTTAVAFDGSDGTYVNAGLAGYPFGTGSVSLEVWLRTTVTDGVLRFIADNKNGFSDVAGMNVAVIDGKLVWRVASTTTDFPLESDAPHILNDGAWHHVVCVLDRRYDGVHDRMLIYIDGIPNAVADLPAADWIITSPYTIELGRQLGTNGAGFIGVLGEWAVYQTALSGAEAAAHYAQQAAAPTPVALQLEASDPDGDALTYSATGLPPGLAVDSATGLISGALVRNSAGTYLVTATVSDATHASSQTFTWTVTGGFTDPDGPANPDPSGYAAEVMSDTPVAYWRLGETTGTSALDSAGTNHGLVSSGVTLGHPGALADGNAAMRFYGVDGIDISVPNGPALAAIDGSSAITMEAWINPQEQTLPSEFRSFFSFIGNPTSYLGIYNDGGVLRSCVSLMISGVQRSYWAGPALSIGSWYHVVATYDGTNLTLYVNGSAVGQTSGLSGPLSVGAAGMVLGGYPIAGDLSFDGLLDEVAIYSHPLTPTRIAAHFARRTPTPVEALVVSASPAAPQPPGSSVTLTATAAGGTSPYSFKWWVLDDGGWTLGRDWSSETTYTWTPMVANPGAHVTVWARSAGNTTDAPERWADLPYPIHSVAVAHLASPSAGETADLSQPLTWAAVPGADAYWVYGGTRPGASDLFNSGELHTTSYDASSLAHDAGAASLAWDVPQDSENIAGYAIRIDGERSDLGLLPAGSCADSPVACYRVALPPVFSGVHTIEVAAYNSNGESYAAPITFSEPYRVVYVRLWTRIGGSWGYTDTWFSPEEVAAKFLHPIAGAINVDPTKPLTWNFVPDAEAFSLTIGRSPGSADVINAPLLAPNVTVYVGSSPPANETLYARLGTRVRGVWRYVEAVFTTAPPP
jgi:hypothetical protein